MLPVGGGVALGAFVYPGGIWRRLCALTGLRTVVRMSMQRVERKA